MSGTQNRGFLTRKNRRILAQWSPVEYPSQFPKRIRERLTQSLADLSFIRENMEESDIAEVFAVLTDPDLSKTTSYSEESFSRETVVDALALFVQAADQVSEQDDAVLESFIRDAITKAYQESRPDHVVGEIDVNIETEPRQEAYDRGRAKFSDRNRLTSAEMRALLDAELPTSDGIRDESEIREQPVVRSPNSHDIKTYFTENIDNIEPGLEVSEFQPGLESDRHLDPDLICEDQNGDTVLVDFSASPASRDRIHRFFTLIEEYGGFDRIRGILVAPPGGRKREQSILTDSDIEYRMLRLGPHGTIKGIHHPDDVEVLHY